MYLTDLVGGGMIESAHDISHDGKIIIGQARRDNGQTAIAYRWTDQTGAIELAKYPYGQANGALEMNGDGSVVVGSLVLDGAEEAFRWTSQEGVVGLGHLPNHVDSIYAGSRATAVTDDGKTIAGQESIGTYETEAFLWTEGRPMRPLAEVLAADYGLDLSGWSLMSVSAMTPDGNVIVGQARHATLGDNIAFRVVVPEPGAWSGAIAAVCSGALLGKRRIRTPKSGVQSGR
jgi:uncharacterized membrane protein